MSDLLYTLDLWCSQIYVYWFLPLKILMDFKSLTFKLRPWVLCVGAGYTGRERERETSSLPGTSFLPSSSGVKPTLQYVNRELLFCKRGGQSGE